MLAQAMYSSGSKNLPMCLWKWFNKFKTHLTIQLVSPFLGCFVLQAWQVNTFFVLLQHNQMIFLQFSTVFSIYILFYALKRAVGFSALVTPTDCDGELVRCYFYITFWTIWGKFSLTALINLKISKVPINRSANLWFRVEHPRKVTSFQVDRRERGSATCWFCYEEWQKTACAAFHTLQDWPRLARTEGSNFLQKEKAENAGRPKTAGRGGNCKGW